MCQLSKAQSRFVWIKLDNVDAPFHSNLARLALHKIHPLSQSTIKVEHRFKTKLELEEGYKNSYGKEMNKEKGGYSSLNTEYLNKKWQYSDKLFKDAVEVKGRKHKYWKLR